MLSQETCFGALSVPSLGHSSRETEVFTYWSRMKFKLLKTEKIEPLKRLKRRRTGLILRFREAWLTIAALVRDNLAR